MAKSFVRDSALNVIAGVATTAGGFVSTVLVARILGVEGTGVVAYATWIVTVVLVLTDLGLSGALARYLPELRARGNHDEALGLTRYLFRRLALSLGATSICFAACAILIGWDRPALPLRSDTFLESALFWALVGAACLVQGLAAFTVGYFKGIEAFGRLAVIAVISGALQISTTLLGGWLFGIVGAMAAMILGSIIPACYIVAATLRRGAMSPALRRRVDRFSWESWAAYLVRAFAWSRMEIFFIERSWGSDAAGLFSVSLTLANAAHRRAAAIPGSARRWRHRLQGAQCLHGWYADHGIHDFPGLLRPGGYHTSPSADALRSRFRASSSDRHDPGMLGGV
jgi:O-antigen/teichoic acid export membrane protein